jgi:hypothetical protein
MMDDGGTTDPTPKKEKATRIRVACIPCKLDKLRCDRERPCSRCQSKGKVHLCIDRPIESSAAEPLKAVEVEVKLTKRPYRKRANRSTGDLQASKSKKPKQTDSSNASSTGSVTEDVPSGEAFKMMFSLLLKPTYTQFIEQSSPLWMKELITEKTDLWRRFLTKLRSIFPMNEALEMKEKIIKAAASTAPDEVSFHQCIESFSKITWFEMGNLIVDKSEQFRISPETFQIIKRTFNIDSLDNSDLAIAQTSHFIDSEGLMAARQCNNENLERLMGRDIHSFGPVINADGTPRTPFILQILTNNSLQRMFKNLTTSSLDLVNPQISPSGHILLEDTWELIRPDSSQVRCYALLMLDSEGHDYIITMVLRPCSFTFDPEKYNTNNVLV